MIFPTDANWFGGPYDGYRKHLPPMCAYYVSAAAPMTFAVAQTYYKLLGTTSPGEQYGGLVHVASNRVRNDSRRGLYVHATASISLSTGAAQTYRARFAKNGVTLPCSEAHRKIGAAGDVGNMGCVGGCLMLPGEYLEVWLGNFTAPPSTIQTQADALAVFVHAI